MKFDYLDMMSRVAFILLSFWLASYFISYLAPKDSTDSPQARSGLSIFIDHKTGCQLLGKNSGGLVYRLDKDGKMMCDVK